MNNKIKEEDGRILDVYLTEYKHVSASILGSEDGRRQIINVIAAVVAASISAVNIFQSQPVLYLFGSLLISLLAWIMIEETARTGIHNRYLRFVLGPKIQRLLNSYHSHPLQYTEFAFDVNPSTIAATAMAPAKYIIGLGTSALFLVLFFSEKGIDKALWSQLETTLVYANFGSFALPIVFGFFNIVALSIKEISRSFKKNVVGLNDERNELASSVERQKKRTKKKERRGV